MTPNAIAIPPLVSRQADQISARVRRISTGTVGFTHAGELDLTEAEILESIVDLKALRIMVRGLRAEARAKARAA